MRLYEYESKTLFAKHGLPLVPRQLVHSAEQALGSVLDRLQVN